MGRVADRLSAARGWSADFIPLMMLTHRTPGIMAHWRDSMSELPKHTLIDRL